MPTFYEYVSQKISPYMTQILIVLALVIFVYAGYYMYSQHEKQERVKKDSEAVYQPMDLNTIHVYFFTADWCPHCKKVKTIINDFIDGYDGKTIKGTKIKAQRVDCTDSSDSESSTMINTYNVSSFPTVKLERKGPDGNRIYDYESKITSENLEQFLNMVMKQ